MRKHFAVFSLMAVAIAAVFGSQLLAAVIAPIGLAHGSQYQLIFVTAGVHDAISADIADYNAFVTAQAALNPLLPSTTWHVVGSTAVADANANAPSNALPVYNTQGLEVASAATGLYTPSLLTQIRYDQSGLDSYLLGNQGSAVWTGSNIAGQSSSPLGSSEPNAGNSIVQSSGWLASPGFLARDFEHFYALSDPITFVPEPSTFALTALAFAFVGLAAWRRRI